jgi:hypothetical protein
MVTVERWIKLQGAKNRLAECSINFCFAYCKLADIQKKHLQKKVRI